MTQYRTIMIATDFSPLGQIAHQAGFELAQAVGAKRIHFEHVVQTGGSASNIAAYPFADFQIEQIFQQRLAEAKKLLEAIKVPLSGVEVTRNAELGVLGRRLIQASQDVKADLIVVASHGYGAFKRTLLGSAASGLIRGAHCPVLVVGEKRKPTLPPARMLVAVDLSPVSESILTHAFNLAAPGAEVVVLSLYDHPLIATNEADVLPRYLDSKEIERIGVKHSERVQAMVDKISHPGLKVRIEAMALAPASQAILDVSELVKPDLICLGTSGHSAWHRLVIGSTATRVLHEANYPVLVVPPPATASS